MIRVTSTEFSKEVGRYQDSALTQPVVVTRNGRDRTVMISSEEYQRLKRRPVRPTSFSTHRAHAGNLGDQPERMAEPGRVGDLDREGHPGGAAARIFHRAGLYAGDVHLLLCEQLGDVAQQALPVLRATANSTNPEIPERLAHGSPPNSGIFDF